MPNLLHNGENNVSTILQFVAVFVDVVVGVGLVVVALFFVIYYSSVGILTYCGCDKKTLNR